MFKHYFLTSGQGKHSYEKGDPFFSWQKDKEQPEQTDGKELLNSYLCSKLSAACST